MVHPFFEYFDSITCISLKSRSDRQQNALSEGEKMGIPFQFYMAEKHPEGGIIGCFMSHLEVITRAYNNGDKNIMVLEDDFCATPAYSNDVHLTNALQFLNKTPDWEILQLGYTPLQDIDDSSGIFRFLTCSKKHPSIIRYTGLTTHAYCMSRKGMKKCIDYITEYVKENNIIHIDKLFCKVFSRNGYCLCPMLIDQKWCFSSDNSTISVFDEFYRKFQCVPEKTKIFYYCSLIVAYREHALLIVFLLIMFLILT
jgi:GR25 family glycosyltransferase involved in LPS biosynthesis